MKPPPPPPPRHPPAGPTGLDLLALNLGNSRCQVGIFRDGQLIDRHHLELDCPQPQLAQQLADLFEPLAQSDRPCVCLASVNPSATRHFASAVRMALDLEPLLLEDDLPIPIGRQLDPHAVVGTDRLLNAAAAFDLLDQACIVIDAGTALTVDFIDGQGTFHGGAILPGAQMMLDALHHRTALLPRVRFDRPDEPIGHNTAQAMLDGAFHGLRGACRELIEKYAELYGAFPRIIATGGNAHTLFDGYELIEQIIDDLTLRGMLVALRYAQAGPQNP